jgi:DNA mismatch repair ATPase MutS
MNTLRRRIGRGTTLHSGLSIAYATLNHILCDIKCRTLFATHYHEVAEMLTTDDKVRDGVQFWCTDVAESVRLPRSNDNDRD